MFFPVGINILPDCLFVDRKAANKKRHGERREKQVPQHNSVGLVVRIYNIPLYAMSNS